MMSDAPLTETEILRIHDHLMDFEHWFGNTRFYYEMPGQTPTCMDLTRRIKSELNKDNPSRAYIIEKLFDLGETLGSAGNSVATLEMMLDPQNEVQ